jgi:hypothetical protein
MSSGGLCKGKLQGDESILAVRRQSALFRRTQYTLDHNSNLFVGFDFAPLPGLN